MQRAHRPIVLTLVAVACVAGFHDLSRRYQGFRSWDGPPAGFEPHPIELTFYLWYLLFGVVTVGCLTLAMLDRGEEVDRLEDRMRALARAPWLLPAAALAVLAGALAVKDLVLAGSPVSDDESIYVFIAKTLVRGDVINPLPPVAPEDLGHFQTNFVVMTDRAWFGKYPIGHPLWLAVGEALGARVIVGPLLAAATTVATYFVARRLCGAVGAAIAVGLLALSPQLVFTAATEHSQNSSQLAMVLALLALLRAQERVGSARRRELVLAGVALGVCALARPLPGVPFALGAAVWVLGWWSGEPFATRVKHLIAPAAVLAVFAALFALVNWRQSGHPLVSGYSLVHPDLGKAVMDTSKEGVFSASLATALARQNVWCFGWPISFAFLPFAARPSREGGPSMAPLWILVVAGYSYRLLAPKVFVGATGPIYVAEVVPLLAVLTASGIVRARSLLAALRPEAGRIATAVGVASALAAISMFVPFELSWLSRLANPHRFTPDVLAARGVPRALVFTSNVVVEPGESWAMWPPPPPPSLDEPIIYVRRRRDLAANVDFWRRYFPDRAAFVLGVQSGVRVLRPLAPGSERPLTEDRR